MNERQPSPDYFSVWEMLSTIPDNGIACRVIYKDHAQLFRQAPGSSHNHQTWPGGYDDHVKETMNIAGLLYDTLSAARPLPFDKSDAYLVMFLHDLEKPFKYMIDEEGKLTDNPEIPDKATRSAKRQEVMDRYGVRLTPLQANALKYVEGIPDSEYTNESRLMGELAALCHSADVLSARMWYNYPAPQNQDEWQGASRINPEAAAFILRSELLD